MKRIILTISNLMIIISLFAQSPEMMSYQTVIRDADNILVKSQTVRMRISILQGSSSGTPVYIETHTTVTNANGLVSIVIGGGTIVSGNFATIDWGDGPYFVKTQTDPNGGTSYSITEISQLLSVPYAQYAKTTASGEHYLGELFGGGIVCWVDDTRQHGTILSLVDISTGYVWVDVITMWYMAGTNDWDGASNTTAIINNAQHISSAAKLCADYINADYGTGVFDDWYLPGYAEMANVYHGLTEISNVIDENPTITPLSGAPYWTSTEWDINALGAYYVILNNFQFNYADKDETYFVRAMRAF